MHTDAALLADVGHVLALADPGESLTYPLYQALGGIHDLNTFRCRFGSWAEALRRAELEGVGARHPQSKLRQCLAHDCGRMVTSWGPGNRVCPRHDKSRHEQSGAGGAHRGRDAHF